MAPTTEIATFPLASGAAIEDADSPAGKVWQSTLDTISQQDGFQRLFWGRELENETVVQLFIDWTTLDDHKRFIASPAYEPFAKHMLTIVDGPLTMHHATLTPHAAAAAALGTASPVTEVLTCYFDKKDETDGSEAAEFVAKFEQLAQVVAAHAEGFRGGAAGGWVVEGVEFKGEKGKRAYVGLLGWESKEAHMAFRETEVFRDNIHLLQGDPVGMEVHHTRFVQR